MNTLGTDFDTALTRGALAALAVAALWSVVVVVAVALEARTGGRVRIAERTGCPRVVRVWLLGVFVALFAGIAPAQASATDPHAVPGSGEAIAAALDGLPLPDRPTDRPVRRTAQPTVQVLVRPGDSLWQIAREHLPRTAADADVARAVERIYAANRRQIGTDPDQIRPGQLLDFPGPTTFPEEP